MSNRRIRQYGLSLIELLVTLSIAVILMAVAVPGLQDFIRRNRVDNAASEYMTAFNYARSEAIRRGARVTVCASERPTESVPSCDAGKWGKGFFVFVDERPYGEFNAGSDTVLRKGQITDTVDITTGGNIETRITYEPSGRPQNIGNDTMRICARDTTIGKRIVFNKQGRMRVEEGC